MTDSRSVVVVTGVSGDMGQGIIRGLRLSTLNPRVVGLDHAPDNVGFLFSDKAYHVPSVADPSYVDTLLDICARENACAVMTGVDGEPAVIAAHATRFEKIGCRLVLSAANVIEAFSDKLTTAQWLVEHELPSPRTVDATSISVGEVEEQFGYPVVFKPRTGHGSRGVFVINDRHQLAALLESPENAVIQEFIDGPEFTVSLLFDDHELKDSLIMRRELVGGRTLRAEVEENDAISELIEAFASHVQAFGSMNVQLRLTPDGRPLVFEVNPRLSGSTSMRVAAGYNEPARILEFIVDGTPIPKSPLDAGTRIYRTWTEIVVRPGES